jgi:hypothetical protein
MAGNMTALSDSDGNSLASSFELYATQAPQVERHEQRTTAGWAAEMESTPLLISPNGVDKDDVPFVGGGAKNCFNHGIFADTFNNPTIKTHIEQELRLRNNSMSFHWLRQNFSQVDKMDEFQQAVEPRQRDNQSGARKKLPVFELAIVYQVKIGD